MRDAGTARSGMCQIRRQQTFWTLNEKRRVGISLLTKLTNKGEFEAEEERRF